MQNSFTPYLIPTSAFNFDLETSPARRTKEVKAELKGLKSFIPEIFSQIEEGPFKKDVAGLKAIKEKFELLLENHNNVNDEILFSEIIAPLIENLHQKTPDVNQTARIIQKLILEAQNQRKNDPTLKYFPAGVADISINLWSAATLAEREIIRSLGNNSSLAPKCKEMTIESKSVDTLPHTPIDKESCKYFPAATDMPIYGEDDFLSEHQNKSPTQQTSGSHTKTPQTSNLDATEVHHYLRSRGIIIQTT